MVQLSHPYMTTGKTIALTRQTFVGKVTSLLFNIQSRLVITFLPRSRCLVISWLQSPSSVMLEPKKGHRPRSRISGSHCNLCSAIFHRGCSIAPSHQGCVVCHFLHTLADTCECLSWMTAILVRVSWYPVVILSCISLMANHVEYLLTCFFQGLLLSFVRVLIITLAGLALRILQGSPWISLVVWQGLSTLWSEGKCASGYVCPGSHSIIPCMPAWRSVRNSRSSVQPSLFLDPHPCFV